MLHRYIPKLVVITTQGVGSVPEETCPWPARVTIYTCHRYLTRWELCIVPVATPKPSTKEGASAIANAVDCAEGTSAIANVVDVADADSNANTIADTLSFTPVDAHKTKSH